jgi:hypothetical protein
MIGGGRRIAAKHATLLLGAGILLFGLYQIYEAARLVGRGVSATGVIEYVARYRIGVRLGRRPGHLISVPKPMLSMPWSFRSNDPIAVLYEPEALDDQGFFHLNPMAREHARLNSWFHLWVPGVLTTLLGLVFLIGYILSVRSPSRFQLRTSFTLKK